MSSVCLSRVGFSGTVDLMALFSVRTHPRWRPPPSWIISNCHIPATAHTINLCRAHRAVIFAIAQFSCINRMPYKKLHHSIFDDIIIIPTLPKRRNGGGVVKYILFEPSLPIPGIVRVTTLKILVVTLTNCRLPTTSENTCARYS